MQQNMGFDAIAEENGFIVVYPDSVSLRNWDFGSGVLNEDGDAVRVDDVDFLVGLMTDLQAEYNIDPEQVYATGFSNGGSMLYYLACQAPGIFNAIAIVAAPMAALSAEGCAEAPISVMLIHGMADPILPWSRITLNDGTIVSYSAVETALFWAEHNQCDLDTPALEVREDRNTTDNSLVRTIVYSSCADGGEVKIHGIDGGGHTWPGHPLTVPLELGATNMDFDATLEIWNWFTHIYENQHSEE